MEVKIYVSRKTRKKLDQFIESQMNRVGMRWDGSKHEIVKVVSIVWETPTIRSSKQGLILNILEEYRSASAGEQLPSYPICRDIIDQLLDILNIFPKKK